LFCFVVTLEGSFHAVLFYKGTKISLASFTAEKAQHEKNLRALRQSKTKILQEIKQLNKKQKKIDVTAKILQAEYIIITNKKPNPAWMDAINQYR